MGILDTVQSYLGPSTIDQVSRHLGIDPAMAQRAIAVAAPLVVAGMARHATSADGADEIHQAAVSHSGALDSAGTILTAGPPADDTGLLGRIFGSHRATVQEGVQQASGLDGERARKLLLMLSPLVLGALARHHTDHQQQTTPQQVTNTLMEEAPLAQQQVQSAVPNLGGVIGQFFGR